ncbi:MAG: 50S ribosomal protein L15e [Candidatus Aenigmarchaeota archaeon]|nr:50S ribosomal protein L15e [Candidatus Aenigmarchaeota archaeon]MBI5229613.1 50S ribosomal protein L15e [Candidatus Micrarchaeota archaeon]
MGMYKYVKEAFEKLFAERSSSLRNRMACWRKESTVERVESPTNLVRARELGFKAKKEFVIARVRVRHGKRARRKPDQGRKPGKSRKRVEPGVSLQRIAENKAAKRFRNLRALNSYFIGEDGVNKYFEVILFNPHSSKPGQKKIKPQPEREAAAAKTEANPVPA